MGEKENRIAGKCYRQGNEALAKQNWDYAIKMFGQCVRLVPDNRMYREILRGATTKKYNDNKSGARMAGMKLMGVKGRIKKSRMQEKWEAVDETAEEGLTVNPWDPWLNFCVGEACEHLGHDDSALFGYGKAVENEPDNKDYLRSLAKLLEDRGQYQEAINYWEKLRKLDPLDGEARGKVTQLQADLTMNRGGYEGAQNTRDVKTAYDHDRRELGSSSRGKSGEVDGPGQSIEADLQREIRRTPEDVNNYVKLADFYKRSKRYPEAAEQYKLAVQVSGGDQNIREQLEDVELDLLRHNLDLARTRASEDNDETARENAAELSRELLNREIEVFAARTEKYPSDLRLKYELAKRFMRRQEVGQAIPLLQQASADTRQQSRVLADLGKCFLHDKKPKIALAQFQKALPNIDQHEDPKLFVETHYMLGRIHEELGNRDSAEEHYTEVIAVEYEYKDARSRLEAVQEAG